MLADDIFKALTDPNRSTKVKRAREYVLNNYTWENIVAKTIEVYEKTT